MLAFDKAVKNLVSFLEAGGKVDYILDEGGDNEAKSAEIQELRAKFQEIRTLESAIKALEDKKSSNPDSEPDVQ